MKDAKAQNKVLKPISAATAHNALRKGQFIPYFQPLVLMRTGQLAGFEVLARWKHPDLGLVSPDRFIFLAEKYGWIDGLAEDLLRKAFAAAAAAIPSPLTLSFNISPIQLRTPSLPEMIREAAKVTGFDLERLVIEVTESALLGDMECTLKVAVELKEMGCKISLDDFGTGYSSLLHLQSLPFDELKVDRSFVSSMTEARQSRKIVAAVVGLGQSLGLRTVAEGIETQDQAEMALWLGCEFGQGWFYGKPVPPEELAAVVSMKRDKLLIGATSPWRRISEANMDMLPAQRLAQVQAIYEGAPVGLSFVDQNLRYVALNKKLADMNGAPIEEHLGRRVSEMIPTLFPAVEPYIRRALAGESIVDVEVHVPDTGEKRLVSYQPARDEAGEVVGVSIAAMKVTERIQTGTTAREPAASSEKKVIAVSNLGGLDWSGIRQVLESVANGITISDARIDDLPLIYANPAFEQMTGYFMAEVFGKNCRFLQGEDKHQPGLKAIRQALLEGRDARAVLKNFKKDGTSFWNELHLSPIRNSDGEITHYLGIQNDITTRVDLDEKLAYMANHDILTGLANRYLLMERTGQAMKRAKRSGERVALLFLDLDNFKYVNDMFGHEAGDGLLKVMGHRLAASTREHETAARLGGDEFVVVLENVGDNEEAVAIMRRLTDELQQPVMVAGQAFRPEASVGIAIYPQDGGTPTELLRAADVAMYLAKHLRKNAQMDAELLELGGIAAA